MAAKVRIGVLGCARVAQRSVIPAIKELSSQFELVAVGSRSLAKARAFAEEFACEAVAGYDALVHSGKIDALYIPLPTGLHREWINKALLAGKHVYAEKSLALNFKDAGEMVGRARQKGLALMEGFMFQYHGQHQIVLDLLKNREIGEPRYFSSSFGFPPLAPDNFRYDENLGGGALLDAGGYPVRACHFILGNDLAVRGATLFMDAKMKTDIYGSAFLTNSRGLAAAVSFGFDNFYQCRYEIWGATGKITVERAFTPRFDYVPKIIVEKPGGTEVIEAQAENQFVRAFEEFYRVIAGDAAKKKHYADNLLQSKTLEQIQLASR